MKWRVKKEDYVVCSVIIVKKGVDFIGAINRSDMMGDKWLR